MENNNNQSKAFRPMETEQRVSFEKMMLEMQTKMNAVRQESIRMSREAERASAMAFLNC